MTLNPTARRDIERILDAGDAARAAADAEASMRAAYAEWGAITPYPTPARRVDWAQVRFVVCVVGITAGVWAGTFFLMWGQLTK